MLAQWAASYTRGRAAVAEEQAVKEPRTAPPLASRCIDHAIYRRPLIGAGGGANVVQPLFADNLDRAFAPDSHRLGEVLVGDITYRRTSQGWLYRATVIDLDTRKVDGWQTIRVPAWSSMHLR